MSFSSLELLNGLSSHLKIKESARPYYGWQWLHGLSFAVSSHFLPVFFVPCRPGTLVSQCFLAGPASGPLHLLLLCVEHSFPLFKWPCYLFWGLPWPHKLKEPASLQASFESWFTLIFFCRTYHDHLTLCTAEMRLFDVSFLHWYVSASRTRGFVIFFIVSQNIL